MCRRAARPGPVLFSTAEYVADGYTRLMPSEKTKTLLFVAWMIVVCLAAGVAGITSVSNWIVVAAVAIVPLFVVRYFWRAPERTMSESISDARR